MMSPRARSKVLSKSKDETCEAILKFFYDAHKAARSMKRSRLKISAVKKGLKQQGLPEPANMCSAPSFNLVDSGGIRRQNQATATLP